MDCEPVPEIHSGSPASDGGPGSHNGRPSIPKFPFRSRDLLCRVLRLSFLSLLCASRGWITAPHRAWRFGSAHCVCRRIARIPGRALAKRRNRGLSRGRNLVDALYRRLPSIEVPIELTTLTALDSTRLSVHNGNKHVGEGGAMLLMFAVTSFEDQKIRPVALGTWIVRGVLGFLS